MEPMNEMLAKALLGQGMARQGADTMQLYPQYQQLQIDNATSNNPQPLPPFEEWAKQFMMQQNQGPM